MSPTISLLSLLISSASFDGGAALQTTSTPQNDAYLWLAGNANLNTYADEQKVQRYVLALLYYATTGDSWSSNSNWLSDLDESSWYGVSTDVADQVTNLVLGSNNLNGTIPSELAVLSNSLGRHQLIS